MHQRFRCRPEHTASCEQGANQDSTPIEEFETWFRCYATESHLSNWTDRDSQGGEEDQYDHPLPETSKGVADDGFAGFREVLC